MDGVRSIARIADALRAIEADIVCLQEVHRHLPGGGWEDQAKAIAQAVGMKAEFSSALRVGSSFGNAVLSHWPIHFTVHTLPNQNERKRPKLWIERRIVQEAQISTDAGPITVLNTHWGLDATDRLGCGKLVSALVERLDGPLILCGDLNAIATSPEVETLAETGLEDAGRSAGEATYPADKPAARIDFIWTRGVNVVTVLTPTLECSDHRPVVVDFEKCFT